jgi:uncharacterized protein with PIN domain
VGKLTGWLRMMGFDSLFFNGQDDSDMVRQALAEKRVILTRDWGIMLRRMVKNGRIRAILISSEVPEKQMIQVMETLDIADNIKPFTRCMECNGVLIEKKKEDLEYRVPPYVFRTQDQYMECPTCRRIYWRGTHWEAMLERLQRLLGSKVEYLKEVHQ